MEFYEKPFVEYINFAMEEIMDQEGSTGASLNGGVEWGERED